MIHQFAKAGRLPKNEMNKTEAKYAWILEMQMRNGEILDYKFEKVKLILGDNLTYTPDFMVIEKDMTIRFDEIKGGFIRDDAVAKYKMACEVFQHFHFRMIQYDRQGFKTIRDNGEQQP